MAKKKKYTVTTPNPKFNGVRNGVRFEDGEGQATEAEAEELVQVWGYKCADLESQAKEGSESITDIYDGEEVELLEKDGVLYPDPSPKANTNDALQAFMDHNEIAYESDDKKADLNAKIDEWVEAQ